MVALKEEPTVLTHLREAVGALGGEKLGPKHVADAMKLVEDLALVLRFHRTVESMR